MASISRYYNTLKYLRWEQFLFRAYYGLTKVSVTSFSVDEIEAHDFVWCGRSFSQQSLFDQDSFFFLGEWGSIADETGWNCSKKSKLWLYNLHYFDDLNAEENEKRGELHHKLMKRWVEENPAPLGNGWEPYPISLRLVNWVKWLSRQQYRDPFLLGSIRQQADVLAKRLEYHILGNHLFANAKALIFVGSFLLGGFGEKYLKMGLKVLKTELHEQFLSDGGHFERSPMYHNILLWDLLDLIQLARLSNTVELEACLNDWSGLALKAISWMETMSHPDAEVSFFNDAAIGIAASPQKIRDYASHLGLGCTSEFKAPLNVLKESGYSRVSHYRHSTFFDHGPIGPDYLPGHAHADTLSVEWSVDQQRVLVNSGTSMYGVSKERLKQRQTAAHNTVVVDDEDSSEVWGGFRVARRAKASLKNAYLDGKKVVIEASHDGYKRLPGKVIHSRKLISSPTGLTVKDNLEGHWQRAEVHFHLHPKVTVQRQGEVEVALILPGQKRINVISDQPVLIEDATWYPEFGVSLANQKLIIPMQRSDSTVCFQICIEV
ncbi:heparinase II/III family protein [Porticoccus sp. GXU_MW_L64]